MKEFILMSTFYISIFVATIIILGLICVMEFLQDYSATIAMDLPCGIGDGHIFAQVMVWGLFWLLVIPIKIWIAYQILLWVYSIWFGVL